MCRFSVNINTKKRGSFGNEELSCLEMSSKVTIKYMNIIPMHIEALTSTIVPLTKFIVILNVHIVEWLFGSGEPPWLDMFPNAISNYQIRHHPHRWWGRWETRLELFWWRGSGPHRLLRSRLIRWSHRTSCTIAGVPASASIDSSLVCKLDVPGRIPRRLSVAPYKFTPLSPHEEMSFWHLLGSAPYPQLPRRRA